MENLSECLKEICQNSQQNEEDQVIDTIKKVDFDTNAH